MVSASLVAIDDRSARCVARCFVSGRTATIQLVGELTGDTIQVLIQNVRTLLSKKCASLRVDLTGVDFLDARGLAAAVVAVKMAIEVDTDIAFVDPRPMMARVLDVGGLADFCVGSTAG
jgi:anti-anti-sigma factor